MTGPGSVPRGAPAETDLTGTGQRPLPWARVARHTGLRHLLLGAIGLIALVLVARSLSSYRDTQLITGEYLFVAVAGLTVLIGSNGQISLGHGALMMVGGYTFALLFGHEPHLPMWLDLVLCVLVTAAVGAVVGAGAARLRGPYLAGATLALAVALPNLPLDKSFTRSLGGSQGLTGPLPSVPSWVGSPQDVERWIAMIAGMAAVIVMVLLANLRRSGVGRAFRAVRDDEVAAQLAGLRVGRTQALAFTVSAGCAGLAGGLLVLASSTVNPGFFDVTLSIGLLAAAILGGLGSLVGAALGTVVLVVFGSGNQQGPLSAAIARGLHLGPSRSASVAIGVYGLELIAVMLLAPRGLVGLSKQVRGARRRQCRSVAEADLRG